MDGSRFHFSNFILACLFISAPVKADTNVCDWSCGKNAKPGIDYQVVNDSTQQVQALNSTASCVLPNNFDLNQNLASGAYQALAISNKTCSFKKNATSPNVQNFLYNAMKLQGIKLFNNNNDPSIPGATDGPLTPSKLFEYATQAEDATQSVPNTFTGCLSPVSEMMPLQAGDILTTKGNTLIIAAVGKDPFGIEAKIADAIKKKKLNLGPGVTYTDVRETMRTLCEKWVTETNDYQITVYHAGGKADLFPTFGDSSANWVTAIANRALDICNKRVSDSIWEESVGGEIADAKKQLTAMPLLHASAQVKVLRPLDKKNKDYGSCYVGRLDVPSTQDLSCVQCCKGQNP